MSRKEVGDKFNVPGPTIRFSILLFFKFLLHRTLNLCFEMLMISGSGCGCCKHKACLTARDL